MRQLLTIQTEYHLKLFLRPFQINKYQTIPKTNAYMLLYCKAYLTHLTLSVLTLTNPPSNAVILPCARNDKQQLLQTLFGMRQPKSQSSRAWNVNSEIHSALFRCSLSETRQSRMALIITQHALLLLQLRTSLMRSKCEV